MSGTRWRATKIGTGIEADKGHGMESGKHVHCAEIGTNSNPACVPTVISGLVFGKWPPTCLRRINGPPNQIFVYVPVFGIYGNVPILRLAKMTAC